MGSRSNGVAKRHILVSRSPIGSLHGETLESLGDSYQYPIISGEPHIRTWTRLPFATTIFVPLSQEHFGISPSIGWLLCWTIRGSRQFSCPYRSHRIRSEDLLFFLVNVPPFLPHLLALINAQSSNTALIRNCGRLSRNCGNPCGSLICTLALFRISMAF